MDTKEVDLLSIDIAYLGPTSLYSEGRDVYEPICSTIPRDVYWECWWQSFLNKQQQYSRSCSSL